MPQISAFFSVALFLGTNLSLDSQYRQRQA